MLRPKIVLFGDSITEYSFVDGGWGAALANHFSRKVDVMIRGYSGYNTRWALQIMEKIICSSSNGITKQLMEDHDNSTTSINGDEAAAAPLAITVFFGANDASLPDRSCAFQHVPLHEYKQNLHSIVSFIKKRWPTTLILLITPPPIDEDGRLRYPYVDNPTGLTERTNEAAGAYAKACVAVAEECGVLVVDLWTKMQQFPNWEKSYLSDGLHLTSSGNRIVFEEVVEKLKEAGLSTQTLPADLPLFADIDPRDPLKAFQA